MDEFSAQVQEFFSRHLLVIILAISGFALLLYGLTSFHSQSEQSVVFEAGNDAVAENVSEKTSATIMVDISGAVAKPGVYQLPQNARVQDAILAAGGMSTDADKGYVAKQINLAAKISDGAKIYIPLIGETEIQGVAQGASTFSTSSEQANAGQVGSLININSASNKELDSLPGVGPVTSEKIVNGRPYTTVDELLKNKIVTQKVFDQIKEKISTY